jgi:hypothetical protein
MNYNSKFKLFSADLQPITDFSTGSFSPLKCYYGVCYQIALVVVAHVIISVKYELFYMQSLLLSIDRTDK